jgi:hypothetical protein
MAILKRLTKSISIDSKKFTRPALMENFSGQYPFTCYSPQVDLGESLSDREFKLLYRPCFTWTNAGRTFKSLGPPSDFCPVQFRHKGSFMRRFGFWEGIRALDAKGMVSILSTNDLYPPTKVEAVLRGDIAWKIFLKAFYISSSSDRSRSFRMDSFDFEDFTPAYLLQTLPWEWGDPDQHESEISELTIMRTSIQAVVDLEGNAANIAVRFARLQKWTEAASWFRTALVAAGRIEEDLRLTRLDKIAGYSRSFLGARMMQILGSSREKPNRFDISVFQDFMFMNAIHKRVGAEGNTVFLRKHGREIFDALGTCSRKDENKLRRSLGVPKIGEGWVSEVELLNIVKKVSLPYKTFHQASPDWLGRQRYDIFVPDLNFAVEYQGRQHFEPVEFFGGLSSFKKTLERDQRKREVSNLNGVRVVYFNYDEQVDEIVVRDRLLANGVKLLKAELTSKTV